MGRVEAKDVRFTDDTRITLRNNQVVRPLYRRFRPRPGGGWCFGAVYAFGPGKSEENHRSASDGLALGLARIGLTAKLIGLEDVVEIHGADHVVMGIPVEAMTDVLREKAGELERRTV